LFKKGKNEEKYRYFLVIILLAGMISSCRNTPSGETELPQAQLRGKNQGKLDNKRDEG